MKISKNNLAIAEIVGAMVLLAIAVTAFSVIYLNILSNPGPSEETYVTIVGKMEQGDVSFDLRRGESLEPDSKIFLNIGGNLYNFSAYQFLKAVSSNLFSSWNIGERFVYPASSIHGDLINVNETVYVDATIVDKKSNSIVFWGILQEGYKKPPYGMGGIWHFNETTGNIAYDSSGNNNHGVLKPDGALGPKWNLTDYKAGNCALSFDYINDFVKVPPSFSLNITDAITVEAWIKPLNKKIFLDYTDLYQKFGKTPNIIHVSDDLYAIVSEEQHQDGIISTYNISVEGEIEYTFNKLKFGDSTSSRNLRPIIEHVYGEMYLIAYIDNKDRLHLTTVNISSSTGAITLKKEYIFADADNGINQPSLIKISNTIYAIAYRGSAHKGILKTVNISLSDGTIQYQNNQLFFDNFFCFEPDIINISNNIYAVVYRGPLNFGIVKTFRIFDTDGTIQDTNKMLVFSYNCYEPDIINVSDKVYAIVYRDFFSNGILKTVNISATNGIIEYTGNMLIFENTACFDPCIASYGFDDNYIICYTTGKPPGSQNGYFISVKVFTNSSIGTITQQKIKFGDLDDKGKYWCYNPIIISISQRVFAIVFEGFGPHPGTLITILTEDPTPPWERGIFRAGSTTIYADADSKTVYACVNGIAKLTLPVTPGIWHYIVLTYDGSIARLYCNFNGTKNIFSYNQTAYTKKIGISGNNLLFGHLFCGVLDEIAIKDRALTDSEIQYHFNHPGFFENEP